MISVAWVRKASQISLAPGSFYIFSSSCLASIVWCVFRLYPTLLTPRPVVSSFPDLDLVSKLKDYEAFNTITKFGSGASSTTVLKNMAGVRMELQETGPHESPGDLELDDL